MSGGSTGAAIHPALESWAMADRRADPIRSLEPVAWGFSTPTAVATTAGGAREAIQLFPDAAAAERSRRGADQLRRAGVPAPRVLLSAPWQGGVVVVTAFIQGTPAAALISTAREVAMARAMGDVAARLRGCDSPGEAIGAWSDPESLRDAAMAWAATLEHAGAGTMRPDLHRAVATACETEWTPALSHGDFVPANALMSEDRVQALVDTADVAVRHPMVDPAWWCLIVRHHHPAESRRLVGAFLAASEPGAQLSARLLASVALLRCVELVVAEPPAGGGWEPLLRSAAAWLEASGSAGS